MDRIMHLKHLIAALTLAAIAGCGGSGSGGDQVGGGGIGGSGSGDQDFAEGGVGGSGSGTMSGYGSIIVNGIRHFLVPESTELLLDGRSVPVSQANDTDRVLPIGIQVEFLIGEDASADLTSGTALVVSARHDAVGPVTGTQPLEVLGQPVQVTGDTVLNNVGAINSLTLAEGDMAAVSGVREAFGAIRATLVSAQDAPAEWILKGRVANLTAAGFDIGDQPVLFNGVIPQNCSGGLSEGQRVVVSASPDSAFMDDRILDTVMSISCVAEGVTLLEGRDIPDTLPTSFEGIITGLEAGETPLETILVLDGQRVRVSLETLPQLVFGTLGDLSIGTHLEVEGTLDVGTGLIEANRIYFRDPLVRITAPVDSVSAGLSLQTLGLTVYGALNLEEDGTQILTNGVSDRQVSVRGYADENNVVYASSIQDVGIEDSNNISLYGPITDVDLENGTFSVLGVAFDLDSSTSISLGDLSVELDGICLDLLNGCDQSLTSSDLLSQVGGNSVADISGATYDALILQDGSIAFND